MNPPLSRTRIRVVHARAPVLDRPQIAAPAPVQAGEVGRVSAKSAAGGLMSGVVGVLARVRRGPAGTMGGA